MLSPEPSKMSSSQQIHSNWLHVQWIFLFPYSWETLNHSLSFHSTLVIPLGNPESQRQSLLVPLVCPLYHGVVIASLELLHTWKVSMSLLPKLTQCRQLCINSRQIRPHKEYFVLGHTKTRKAGDTTNGNITAHQETGIWVWLLIFIIMHEFGHWAHRVSFHCRLSDYIRLLVSLKKKQSRSNTFQPT
jgi:hypothetical protein